MAAYENNKLDMTDIFVLRAQPALICVRLIFKGNGNGLFGEN